jgi:hypothetical protein
MVTATSAVESRLVQASSASRTIQASPLAIAQSTTTRSPSFASKLVKSRFLVATVLFISVTAAWGSSRLGALSPSDFPFYTWTACAIEDFLSNEQGRPQIDFVGSSLVLAPLGGVDADYTNKPVDAPHHHRSLYFENAFKKQTGESYKTFNFALPGEMPSDAYLMTKFLMKGEKRPDVIVYGVGPRDFLDNLLPSPSATDPYLWLSRFGDVNDHIALISPDWQDRLNYEMGRLIYPYGQKMDLTNSFSRAVTAMLNKVVPATDGGSPLSVRRTVLPEYRNFEVGKNECMFTPTTDANRPSFADNIDEYRKRYKKLKWDTYLTQMRFMTDILNIAKERKTHMVIVAMPITEINRGLLNPLAWDVYKKSIKVIALAKGATFIDMESSGKFQTKDFSDTVHLHSGGGAKLLDLLSVRLAADPAVMAALHKPANVEERSATVAGLKGTIQ